MQELFILHCYGCHFLSGPRELISFLLKKNPELRLPLAKIKEHPWIKTHLNENTLTVGTEVKPESSAKKPSSCGVPSTNP